MIEYNGKTYITSKEWHEQSVTEKVSDILSHVQKNPASFILEMISLKESNLFFLKFVSKKINPTQIYILKNRSNHIAKVGITKRFKSRFSSYKGFEIIGIWETDNAQGIENFCKDMIKESGNLIKGNEYFHSSFIPEIKDVIENAIKNKGALM